MIIKDMFRDDINRNINGVVQVQQEESEVLKQELEEYVVTKEIRKHLISFFKSYGEAFDAPTSDTGVWISGFFGSGKSHFLKMLSYLLENREVDGKKTVEYFRTKLEDDPETFQMIEESTQNETEVILFNIDRVGLINKDKTAVLRVFAKVFYQHLGYYGENLKVALMEQYLDSEGKYEDFKQAFEAKKGKSWESQRRAYAFNGSAIVPALMEVLNMSEEDAKAWFANKKDESYSIETLVDDINKYIATKSDDFRLLFMIDEVGQYVGGDTDLLINLQSIVESVGSICKGKVWVACTGQEAIDEIIKTRVDEFSRIQARFKTRLSLSSSSADEVIQKRILKKTPEAEKRLKDVYQDNEAVMRNLFSFTDAIMDIKGFESESEFSRVFPFIPYQFTILQKVFTEIRRHGNAGKHLGSGERSMLSGFLEAAQKIQTEDEFAIAPFHLFYNTVETFLEDNIKRVIFRCQRAADSGAGIEQQDVDLLKLLFLIRYIDDIPANLDNLVILMSNDIRMDKITMREHVRNSLDRLYKENYIGRTGDVYNFLTDEEQDIAIDIKNTAVDTTKVITKLSNIIFGDIYKNKKFRYSNTDFAFDQYVDGMAVSKGNGDISLKFLSVATEDSQKAPLTLTSESTRCAIVVLGETSYFEKIESSQKIRNYVKQRNISTLAKSVKDIIGKYQEEATRYDNEANELIKKAIEQGQFYSAGEQLNLTSGDAKCKIEEALQYLIEQVYSEIDIVNAHADSDLDILKILKTPQDTFDGTSANHSACDKVYEYLEIQKRKNLPTSMADIQQRYQSAPYGWKEIDVAAVVAELISRQKIDIKYSGEKIAPVNPKLPDMLRKRSEIGKTNVIIHESVGAGDLREAKEFCAEYFDMMDVPGTEKELIEFIIANFEKKKAHLEKLVARYDENHKYPDKGMLVKGIAVCDKVLSQKADGIALIKSIVDNEDELFDTKDDLAYVEAFFDTQVVLFDRALKFVKSLRDDEEYLKSKQEVYDAFCEIRKICIVQDGVKYNYRRIPELNALLSTVESAHNLMLDTKKAEVRRTLSDCIMAIMGDAGDDEELKKEAQRINDIFFNGKDEKISECNVISILEGMQPQFWQKRDDGLRNMQSIRDRRASASSTDEPVVKKNIKTYQRSAVFAVKTLESEADVDEYLNDAKKYLLDLLKNSDGIRMN